MVSETARPSPSADDPVMAAVDDAGTVPEYVIADVSRDEAWLAMDVEEAPILPDWR